MADQNNTTAGIRIYGEYTSERIENSGANVTISGGGGDDTVVNQASGKNSVIELGWGTNSVTNYAERVSIKGGGRDDVIETSGDYVTVNGYEGDDTVKNNGGDCFVYEFNPNVNHGKFDVVEGFNTTSRLRIVDTSGNLAYTTYRRITQGDDIIVKFDKAAVTLKGAAKLSQYDISGGSEITYDPVPPTQHVTGTPNKDNLQSGWDSTGDWQNNAFVDALADNDTVQNYRDEVTIKGGDGNDSIYTSGMLGSMSGGAGNDIIEDNMGGHNVLDGGDGDDVISMSMANYSTVFGGAGNDSIHAYGYKAVVDAGDDNDTVDVGSEKIFADGGNGDDVINVLFDDATVTGGHGDDKIKIGDTGLINPPQKTLIEYNAGDGNDIIEGFNETSTLKIGGTYSTTQSGNDIILKVGAGSITLKDAANLTTLNIDGIEGSESPNDPPSDDDNNIIWGTPNKDNLSNTLDNMIINALEDNDTVTNSGDRVTINGDGGDDSISNEGTDGTINGGDGDDEISNYGDNTTIYGGHGKDSVLNDGNNAFILDDAGDDYFHNIGDGVTVHAGDGDDFIDNLDGDDVFLTGGQGNDRIRNVGARATMYGIYDNNTLESYNSEKVSMVGGEGNDSIINLNGEFATIEGGIGDDTVRNSGDHTKINAGHGEDSIVNSGNFVTVESGGGDDEIENIGSNTSINGGTGDDSILNNGDNVTIDVGEDNDIVDNYASNVTINGDAGNDLINNMVTDTTNRMTNVKIDGGDDDDVINSNGNSVTIDGGTGSDILRNFGGKIVVMDGGDGDDHLVNNVLTQKVTMNGGDGNDTIENYSDYVTISAGAGNDSIKNTGKAKIDLGDGDDTLETDGAFGTITGTGNNVIKNLGEYYKINLGDGNDIITNDVSAMNMKIDAGDGNNRIENNAVVVTIKTGAGNDYIKNTADCEVTITTGAGNDTVELGADVAVVTVADFGAGDEIWLPNPASSLTFTGNQFFGNSINVNCVTGSDIEIDGIDKVATVNYFWSVKNGVATYSKYTSTGAVLSSDGTKIIWSDTAKTEELFKISGLKDGLTVNADGSIDGLTINGNQITVSKNVLSTTEVSVDNGYELVLGEDVPVSYVEPEKRNVNEKTQWLSYTSSYITAGWQIENGKIVYEAERGRETFTISGLAKGFDPNKISVNGHTVTLPYEVLNGATNVNITTFFGYKLALGNDCPTVTERKNYWKIDGTKAIYYAAGKTDGFALSSNGKQITYTAAVNGTSVFSLSGLAENLTAKDLDDNVTVNGKKITVNSQILGENFSVPSDYVLEFAQDDYTGKNFIGGTGKDTVNNYGDNILINGGANSDSIYTEGRGVTIAGGKGNDKITSGTTSGNVYQYATGDGYDTILGYNSNDTIQITDGTNISPANFSISTNKRDLIIKIARGSITLKNAAVKGNKLTFIDKDGKKIGSWTYVFGMFVQNEVGHITTGSIEKEYSANSNKMSSGISNGDISNADLDDSEVEVEIQHIDGSLAKSAVKLIGDEEDNSLIGGTGSDTIIGGGGEDTFVGGKGNDLFIHDGGDVTIADYGTGSDKVSLGNALDGFDVNDSDVILNAGTGSVTIKDILGKKVTVIENGKSTTETYTFDGKTNSAGTSIKLTSSTQSFAADTKIVTIDAGLTNGATISGNTKSNKIFGGDGDDVLIGMSGNDTLFGGAGSDIFIYDSGKDVILDFNGDEDKLTLSTGKVSSSSVNSKGDVVLKVGTGSVTIKKLDDEDISDGKTITIVDVDGEATYTYFSEKIISDDGKVTLNSNFKGTSYTADKDIYEVDASAVTKKFAIRGNDNDNTITGGKGANLIDGGKGDDLLIGGNGNDTFVTGAGDDTIADYMTGSNKISLGSAQIKNYSVDDSDVIFYFKDANSLTVKDTAGEKITLVENGKSVVNVYAEDGMFNTAKTAVTLAADTQIFSAANYSKLTTIDGSAVDGEVEIIGNSKNNKIYAGDFDSTLNGGKGNDTLWGSDGSDTFIYENGGGKDTIIDFGAEDMLQIGADFTASLKNNSVVFKVGTTSNAITLKDFSGTEFVANDNTYQLNGSKFEKK